jgi:hypothetical protein
MDQAKDALHSSVDTLDVIWAALFRGDIELDAVPFQCRITLIRNSRLQINLGLRHLMQENPQVGLKHE